MSDRHTINRMLTQAGIAFEEKPTTASVCNRKTGDDAAEASFSIEVVLDKWHGVDFFFDEQGVLLDMSGWDNG